MGNDIRYALRGLARNPSFAVIALAILALGIGANTAIFSVVDGVLLRPLPYPHASRLVWGWGSFQLGNDAGVSAPDFLEYRAQNRSFDRLAAFSVEDGLENLAGGDQPVQVTDAVVSEGFFEAFGAQPLLGRTFNPADEQVAQPQVVVLSEGLWRRRFGADPGLVGKTVSLGGKGITVAGVMPASFDFPAQTDLWLPIPLLNPGAQSRTGHWLRVVGLLKPSVSLRAAQAGINTIAGRLAAEYPATNKSWTLLLEQLQQALVGDLRPALLVLLGAVGLVLLIACSNVASLLVVRAAGRRREIAIRQALGATRFRLVRQLMTESVILAVAGGGLGMLLGSWGLQALRSMAPAATVSRLGPVQLDTRALLATLAISILVGLLFGLAPASEAGRGDAAPTLKEGERAGTSISRRSLRRGLVVVEVSLSLVLLVGSGLLIHSLRRLLRVNPGFAASHVVTTEIVLADASYPTEIGKSRFFISLLGRLRGQPGIGAAGAISELPLSGQYNDNWFTVKGRPAIDTADKNDARNRVVTPGYFSAMQIPLLAGRSFSDQDDSRSPLVAIVDQQFVRRYFQGLDPFSQFLVLTLDGRPTDVRVVGVVGGVRDYDLSSAAAPEFYMPYAQLPRGRMNLVVRGAAAPGAIASEVRAAVSATDPEEAVSEFRTMPQLLAANTAQQRFTTLLLSVFAGVAVLLAAAGLYGVLAYLVAGRTREIGIRIALGARRPEILRLVLGEGMALAGIGAVLGAAASFGLARLLASQLFEVGPMDFPSFVVAVAVLATAALAACWLPARRAMQVNPVIALRHE
ncbi:MAG TPA: ABC transporter permease [Candidatus Acidoferrales bacterium]|nr:ABC transporter permease [Candidatus Acidoferrales bacterium]